MTHLAPNTGGRAKTPFEVIVGAVLTQNTSWQNVERAIHNLREADLLEPKALYDVPVEELEELLRPAGYFRIKAGRLRSLLTFLVEEFDGSLEAMFQTGLPDLRERLLAVHGIGPETADSILLYAGQLPTFVVDAYTHRVFARHGWINFDADYHQIQDYIQGELAAGSAALQRVSCVNCPAWQRFLPEDEPQVRGMSAPRASAPRRTVGARIAMASLFDASEAANRQGRPTAGGADATFERWKSLSASGTSWAKASCCGDCWRPIGSGRSSSTARRAPERRRSPDCWPAPREAISASLSAVTSGVKEMREVLAAAYDRLSTSGQRTLLFVDEIHRFNKAQQDVLLPDVEDGVVILVGATTENPFFTINSALVSRSRVFQFQPLSTDDIKTLIRTAIEDKQRGLGRRTIHLHDDALGFLAEVSDGDARRALSALEVGVLSSHETPVEFTRQLAEESVQRKAVQ